MKPAGATILDPSNVLRHARRRCSRPSCRTMASRRRLRARPRQAACWSGSLALRCCSAPRRARAARSSMCRISLTPRASRAALASRRTTGPTDHSCVREVVGRGPTTALRSAELAAARRASEEHLRAQRDRVDLDPGRRRAVRRQLVEVGMNVVEEDRRLLFGYQLRPSVMSVEPPKS